MAGVAINIYMNFTRDPQWEEIRKQLNQTIKWIDSDAGDMETKIFKHLGNSRIIDGIKSIIEDY